ncbi:LD-carboxypeptidase [Paludibacterium denitrificans]|uniref:LD-carboxypeptidase n=1 Tax=Paludibacterium denitrificans TaxID=2675226 RepID=UPI001E407EF0|nr:LD-carboxypeptidase [Paludibacterium denitrificans]
MCANHSHRGLLRPIARCGANRTRAGTTATGRISSHQYSCHPAPLSTVCLSTDAERLNDLNQLIAHQDIPGKILAGRGGYGAVRLLPQLDYARLCPLLREAGTQIIGYSDFTAIQLALLAQGQLGSFAGPMVYGDFGCRQPSHYTQEHFIGVTTQASWTLSCNSQQVDEGQGEGLFWGGNLSVLCSLLGSPYFPDIKGGLLFLEDVGEQPYRIERMLQQLYLSGVLGQQKAIFMGDFGTGNMTDAYDSNYTLATVIAEIRQICKIPVFTGIPFGHTHHKTTLPLGFPASYQAAPDQLTLTFSDYPHHCTQGLNLSALLTPND